jgi:hypothetical protein
MRPERPSGASGCPQAQENGTEHSRAGRTCVESVGAGDARAGSTATHACAGYTAAYARARAGASARQYACEPNALTLRALSFFP